MPSIQTVSFTRSPDHTTHTHQRLTAPTLLFSSLLIFCQACVPYLYTAHPGGAGVVVDATSKSPIAGAQVSLYSQDNPAKNNGQLVTSFAYPPAVTTTADANGRFAWPAKRYWGIYILGADFATNWWRLDVQSTDHHRFQSEFMGSVTYPNIEQFKIEQQPGAPTPAGHN
jgi:hypothetical protein